MQKVLRVRLIKRASGAVTPEAERKNYLRIEDYLKDRVEDQINWYDKKAISAQKQYKKLQFVEIIVAACIPLLVGYVGRFSWMQFVIGVLGVIITVIEGYISLNKVPENWIEYRSTCELLRHEKFLFEMKAPPYGDSESTEGLFVKNIELLISSESNKWKATNSNPVSTKNQGHSSTGS